MTPNTTIYAIELSLGLWRICDSVSGQEYARSATWEGAVKAAKEIQSVKVTPSDLVVSTCSYTETIRYGHLQKVLAARRAA